eukprot:260493-Amphidinium_carterae.2
MSIKLCGFRRDLQEELCGKVNPKDLNTSSEVPPCTKHIPSCEASPAGAKLAPAQTRSLSSSFSSRGLNLRPKLIHRPTQMLRYTFKAVKRDRTSQKVACFVTNCAALETLQAIPVLLLNASQFNEPATPARFGPCCTACSYSLRACGGSSGVFPKLPPSPAEVLILS